MASQTTSADQIDDMITDDWENYDTTPSIDISESDRASSTKHLTFVNMKVPGDLYDCSMNDIVCFDNKKILIADNANLCFKVFDQQFQLIIRQKIHTPEGYRTRCLTPFRHTEFCAILDKGDDEYIRFYRVEIEKVVYLRQMKVHAIPIGISIGHREQIAVTCKGGQDEGNLLRILDSNGDGVITHEIRNYDKEDKKLCISPYHTFSPSEDKIYMSDLKHNKVVCIDLTGNILWEVFFHKYSPGYIIRIGEEIVVAIKSLWALFAIEKENGRKIRWFMNRRQLPNRPNVIRVDPASPTDQSRLFIYRDAVYHNYIDVFQVLK